MNKVFIALIIAGFFYFNAAAQKTHNNKVAKKCPKIKGILKVTKNTVVMNFKVCKSDNGYVICGEAPGNNNSTFDEPQKPRKYPAYEATRPDVIMLKGLPEVPKTPWPMNKPGPETQSGAWFGINSWNGIW